MLPFFSPRDGPCNGGCTPSNTPYERRPCGDIGASSTMLNIFVTGATGYIGGDFLFTAVQAHPDWNITCLVRDRSKGVKLTSRFPNLRIVYGSLESSSILELEASKANIVFHFASADHLKGAEAIARGLARNTRTQAFWIHTSGAGILTHQNFAANSYGHALDSDRKVYNDWENIRELTSLPDKAIHRHVEKVVLSASVKNDHVRTAIVSPPCIYGIGRGTGNTTSVQVYVAAQVALEHGKAIKVGQSPNIWHEVHIHDLSKLYLLLGEAASEGGGSATWNENGYYLAENGSFVWKEVIHAIAREGWLQGFLNSADVESVDSDKAKDFHRYFPHLCATTSRGVSKRAQMLLGWRPEQKGLMDHIPEIVLEEAKRLHIKPSKTPRSAL